MSDKPSDTPRTDEVAWMAGERWEEKDEVVDADFARTLESELAAANQRLAEYDRTEPLKRQELADLREHLAAAIMERDDLAKEVRTQINMANGARMDAERYMRERDAYKKAKQENDERFMLERDEALALLESERATRNHIIQRGVEVERERDEARAALRDMLWYWDKQMGSPELSADWRKAAGMEG